MPWLVQNIDSAAYQRHTLLTEGIEVIVDLRFHSTVGYWTADCYWLDRSVVGVKLAVGCLHFQGANLPFDLAVIDLSGAGIDPFHEDDFASGRCALYLVLPSEMRTVRGLEVQLTPAVS